MKVIDTSVLNQQLGGDNEFLAEVIADFRQQRVQISTQLKEALHQRKFADINAYAHRIKGSLLTLGASSAADAAFQVESISLSDDLERTAAAVNQLEVELDRLEPELKRLAERGFGG